MNLATLTLKRFRSFENETFTLHPAKNLVLGLNAQGKTTVLEAIHVLALGKSHRLSKDEDLIRIGEETAHIAATGKIKGAPVKMSLSIGKDGKRVKFNGQEMRRLSDCIGRLNVVMFSPDDLDLVKGEPGRRRRFLDMEVGQLTPEYVKTLNRYRLRLKERNAILKAMATKEKYDSTTLQVVTERLAEAGEFVVRERKRFVEALNVELTEIFPVLAPLDPQLAIAYHGSAADGLLAALQKKERHDMIQGMTSVGAHRDDLGITLGGRPARIVASQGQMRSIVLALKLAVARLLECATEDPPVILLDDVFSELDRPRRERLVDMLGNDAQLFITATDLDDENRGRLGEHRAFTLDNGHIEGVDIHG